MWCLFPQGRDECEGTAEVARHLLLRGAVPSSECSQALIRQSFSQAAASTQTALVAHFCDSLTPTFQETPNRLPSRGRSGLLEETGAGGCSEL
jgi:hypothetical protein